jgi:hypothetical protein
MTDSGGSIESARPFLIGLLQFPLELKCALV